MSWIEVETKIKVYDVNEARKKIKKIAKFIYIEKKVDDYYALNYKAYPKKSLRVRYKGKKREVNFKQRLNYKNGIWAKKEVEFEVSDLKGFYELLDDFGFRRWLRKQKMTELYRTKDGVNIELNHVKNLGWFIEIEIISKENYKEIANARKKITRIRKLLGIKNKYIEKIGYTRKLWDLKKRK